MKLTLQQMIESLAALKREQTQAGRAFAHLSPEQLTPLLSGNKPFFSSVSWSEVAEPGGSMYYAAWVTNPTDAWITQAGVTTFFGPGQLAPQPVKSLELRDPAWPVLDSESFSVEPGKTVRVEIGHKVDHPVRAGARGMLNFLLWDDNSYSQAALFHARFHVRFRVAGK